jgi:hypothetical protein
VELQELVVHRVLQDQQEHLDLVELQEQLVMMDLTQEDGVMEEQLLTPIPDQAGFLVIIQLLVVLLN